MNQNGEFKIGLITGTGLNNANILKNAKRLNVTTPFGEPSSQPISGEINDVPVVCLLRHGADHSVSPSLVNYRANIWALKAAGASLIVATSACGSLREEIEPGHFVIVDSFFDRTTKREQTFYDGIAGHPKGICHIPMHPAFNEKLRSVLATGLDKLSLPHHITGTMVCIEGPRFSSLAESQFYRGQIGLNASLVGMTVCPEVVLSKEMGIPYAMVGLVTDYDVWRGEENNGETVSVKNVSAVMERMAIDATKLIIKSIQDIYEKRLEFDEEIEKSQCLAREAMMPPHGPLFE